ncbi:recombinase family protein [Streptomyces sp. NPDC057509]|uniref:recombinase family protein n=1 Tax=Streptomyces sp. NPDC057509 TaxID=3346152 RepID=UPI003695D7FD
MPIVARPCLPGSAAIVVAKYARVSTAEQLDGFGLEDQNRISDGWLARHPEATVYDEYVDEAASGALESRPEMDRLVLDARLRRFNRILVPAVDRIGRTARAAVVHPPTDTGSRRTPQWWADGRRPSVFWSPMSTSPRCSSLPPSSSSIRE